MLAVATAPDPVDALFAGMVIHAEMRRGATRQELIDLAVRLKRLDVVKFLLSDAPERD
jgi:hypothetical protein